MTPLISAHFSLASSNHHDAFTRKVMFQETPDTLPANSNNGSRTTSLSISNLSPVDLCRRARLLWLGETDASLSVGTGSIEDNKPLNNNNNNNPFNVPGNNPLVAETPVNNVQYIEQLYRQVWDDRDRALGSSDKKESIDRPVKRSKIGTDHRNNDRRGDHHKYYEEIHVEAGSKLALLLLQDGRTREADDILQCLGYTCRLAHSILNYSVTLSNEGDDSSDNYNDGSIRETHIVPESPSLSSDVMPCRVYDQYLTPPDLALLQSVFVDPQAPYWTDHLYSVEPPSPYFSYLIPLPPSSFANKSSSPSRAVQDVDEYGFLGRLVQDLQHHVATTWKTSIAEQATVCEMWAHNRPHTTGHQLHFDSDNEGQGGVIKNPLFTCILYLTGTGGPSLVTNQRVTSRSLVDRGWLCPAKKNRLLVMDGRMLHGVIPGKCEASSPSSSSSCGIHNVHNPRRVTLMIAFWKDIRLRDLPQPGAARPIPRQAKWAQSLLCPRGVALPKICNNYSDVTNTSCADEMRNRRRALVQPVLVECVYESILNNGSSWKRSLGFPSYEEIFQGF